MLAPCGQPVEPDFWWMELVEIEGGKLELVHHGTGEAVEVEAGKQLLNGPDGFASLRDGIVYFTSLLYFCDWLAWYFG